MLVSGSVNDFDGGWRLKSSSVGTQGCSWHGLEFGFSSRHPKRVVSQFRLFRGYFDGILKAELPEAPLGWRGRKTESQTYKYCKVHINIGLTWSSAHLVARTTFCILDVSIIHAPHFCMPICPDFVGRFRRKLNIAKLLLPACRCVVFHMQYIYVRWF